MEIMDGRLMFDLGIQPNHGTYHCVGGGFLPSYYIGSGALSKSAITVSLRDTRLVSENGK